MPCQARSKLANLNSDQHCRPDRALFTEQLSLVRKINPRCIYTEIVPPTKATVDDYTEL